MDRTKKSWTNLIFLAVTLAINALGAFGLINGLTQKEISDMYVTRITPSPSTFSIWGVIYTLLIISVVVMIIKKKDPYYECAIDKISVLFWISCIMNIAWIVAFSFVQIELSVVFIFGFLLILSVICQMLLRIQDRKRWLLPLCFGLYTGWLFIASVVNTAAMLVKLEWSGFGIASNIWAILILIVAVILVMLILLKNRNAVLPLPIAWAYLGIYQFLRAPEGFNGEYVLLQTVAIVGMIVLIGVAAIQLYRNQYSIIPVTTEKQKQDK